MSKYIILVTMLVLIIIAPCAAFAGTYTYNVADLSNNYGNISHDVSGIDIVGINTTHEFSVKLPATITSHSYSSYTRYTLNYTLPDDGSDWRIVGTVTISSFGDTGTGGTTLCGQSTTSIDLNKSTPGSFTGYSLKTATDAANTAAAASSSANTAANNAFTAANNAKAAADNATTAANNAKTSADNSTTAANTASVNALNAYNETVVINNKLDSLTNDVGDLDTSEIASAVKDPNGNTITSVRDSNGTVLYASRSNGQKIDALQTTVNNYLSADNTPPIIKLATLSGAWATSGNDIRIIINVTDNVSSTFQYSLDDIVYKPIPVNKTITVPVNNPGSNMINVWVLDEAGNKTTDFLLIRKL